MARDAVVALTVEHDVLVNLVRKDIGARVSQRFGQAVEVLFAQDRAGRVVRKVDDDQARLVGQRVAEPLPVDLEVGA